MLNGNKLPIEVKKLASLMQMTPDEIRVWPYLNEVREIFKDYNFGVLDTENLKKALYEISLKCSEQGIAHYSEGIEKSIGIIQRCY